MDTFLIVPHYLFGRFGLILIACFLRIITMLPESEIGRNIRKMRNERKYTLEDLSTKTGYSEAISQRWKTQIKRRLFQHWLTLLQR